MSAWANVATLGKAKNLKGGLLAYAREGLPFLLEEDMEVTFVPPLLRFPRTGRVTQVVHQGGDAYLVQFDTVDSIDLAEQLQDHSCLVRKADLPEDYEHLIFDLTGFRVADSASGLSGIVRAVEQNPAHPLLVVALDNESGDEEAVNTDLMRIPLVEDFIDSIDEDGSMIRMHLPEGLFDL